MTKDELIDLADRCNENSKNPIEFIQKFADAVALAEREACAKLIPPQYFELRDRIRARGQA